MTEHPQTVEGRPDMENRRCRAAVWDESSWLRHQCGNRAKDYRTFWNGHHLPVCGVHLRSRGRPDEYQAHDAYDAAVEAVAR